MAKNLNELSYAPWLEQALQELVEFPVRGLCMFAFTEDGSVYSNYHDVSMMDKLALAGLIQQDAMYDSMGFQEEYEENKEEQ